jgi:hypothetical protein
VTDCYEQATALLRDPDRFANPVAELNRLYRIAPKDEQFKFVLLDEGLVMAMQRNGPARLGYPVEPKP